MRLAARLGLRVGESTVQTLGGVTTIIVTRYDRRRTARGIVRRVHQEDFCQALSRLPRMKYQSEGGPSAEDIVRVIREFSSAPKEDEERFLDALIFNWLIAGTDGHGKNFSLLLAGGGQVRLAPLYDLGSARPYFPRQLDPRRARLAMKIGGHYRWREIAGREWGKLAALWRVDEAWVRGRIEKMAAALPAAAEAAGHELTESGLTHPVVARLVESLRAVRVDAGDLTLSAE